MSVVSPWETTVNLRRNLYTPHSQYAQMQAYMIRADTSVSTQGQIAFIRETTQINCLPLSLTHSEESIISRHFVAVIQSSKSEPVVSSMKGQRLSASYRCKCMCVYGLMLIFIL